MIVIEAICPRCGHCSIIGGNCLACEMDGRESVPMIPRTMNHRIFGVPTPLFFLAADGHSVIPTTL